MKAERKKAIEDAIARNVTYSVDVDDLRETGFHIVISTNEAIEYLKLQSRLEKDCIEFAKYFNKLDKQSQCFPKEAYKQFKTQTDES